MSRTPLNAFSLLPDEILLSVVQELSPDALYNLSVLSRRLHRICLPLFLSRHSISDPTTKAEIIITELQFLYPDYGADALSGLQIALFVPYINHIHVQFPHPGMKMEPLLRLFRRLRALVSRLSSVNTITFYVDDPAFNDTGSLDLDNLERTSKEAMGVDVDGLLRAFSSTFGHLLNEILKKSCSAFTLTGSPTVSPSYSLWSPENNTLTKRPGETFRDVAEKIKSGSRQYLHLGAPVNMQFNSPGDRIVRIATNQIISETRSRLRMNTLTLWYTPHFVHPPFSLMTLAILRACDVWSLRITAVRANQRVWNLMFPSIVKSAPQLHTLIIDSCFSNKAAAVLRSIYDLPRLKWLTLGRSAECNHADLLKMLETIPFSPKLSITKLSAPLDWIFQFLTLYGGLIPMLTDLFIYTGQPSSSDQLSTIFAALPSVLRRLRELNLFPNISFSTKNTESKVMQISFGDPKDFPPPAARSSEAVIPSFWDTTYPTTQAILRCWQDVYPASLQMLECISNVLIKFLVNEMDVDDVSLWLKLFPATRHLKADIENGEDLAYESVPHLRRAVELAYLPKLSSFMVGEKEFSVN